MHRLCGQPDQSRGNSLSAGTLKFLADQDVYEATVRFLEKHGYEVLRARDAGLARATDEALLMFANETKQVLITRDKGFGQLVFLLFAPHSGVILPRVTPSTLEAVHQELLRFLEEHKHEDFSGWFVVIEPGRHRIRRRG